MSSVQIEKPKNATWTDDQWHAITAGGKDVLVAAAAGSGKTAVLVERIIKKIISKEDPVDVDRLLVVTFTNAAAAEMRKRIGEGLEKALAEDPASLHLRRQLTLINKASISTLHSFCMDVLRKYYYKLDLDPGFRIVDSTEAELMREEVIEELFEDQYGKENNEAFYDLVDRYSNDRSDIELQQLIRNLYDFSRAYPWPDQWLDQIVSNYEIEEGYTINDLPWTQDLMQDIQLQLEGSRSILLTGLDITKEPAGPAPYAENLTDDLEQVEKLIYASGQSWEVLYESFQSLKFGTLKRCKKGEFDEILQKEVKDLRDKVKKQVTKLKDELFTRAPESYVKDLKEMAPVIKTLIELVKNYGERFLQVKQEKGLVDFNDLEHLCLSLLFEEGSTVENLKPTNVALDLQNHFNEVLVDEYQDTNLVQETLLKLITNGSNMFMVGDVKQSIYRFRLAEPGLFLSKYKLFGKDEDCVGIRIDLAKNFRSRAEVLDGTNYVFKQIMNETVGEIDYDEDAELKVGAAYPEADCTEAELVLIDRGDNQKSEDEELEDDPLNQLELETAQLEGRALALKIKQVIEDPKQIVDKSSGRLRNVTYRDIVILQRSFSWAPTIMEELKKEGIPVYAELSTGYFEAVEVSIMMSLLKVIDNPFQDIPLAAVLRSPIVGLTEEELALIRIEKKKGHFYQSLKNYLLSHSEGALFEKLDRFMHKLKEWRVQARQGALADLIWQIYRETRFYDYVGGMSGGRQRQANLRSLYDRAKQYESTSFRGLFRFLRFIERMQDRGDDLGAARALGEQEDVVRMMTIHKSKGLEFPVVFVSGLSKQFNMMDLRNKVMLHKELGFGSKFVNPKLRVSYPTLPQLAIKKRMQMELIAEEMRVLYVALTRAKEKLYLVGSVKDAEKTLNKWSQHVRHSDWLLPDYERAQAMSYLDWVGPALVRHVNCSLLNDEHNLSSIPDEIKDHPSKWNVEMIEATKLQEELEQKKNENEEIVQALKNWYRVDIQSPYTEKVIDQISWKYPYQEAERTRSKQSVTEIKRQQEIVDTHSDTTFIRKFKAPIESRPRFLQKNSLTAAERGTAMHMVMQHVDLSNEINENTIKELVSSMVNKELLTETQAEAIDTTSIAGFFETDIGTRLLQAGKIHREVPFSMAIPTSEVYKDWGEAAEENILVQGVMDCIMEEVDGLVLIDYKTDAIIGRYPNGFEDAEQILEQRYKTQVELYARAIEQIWKTPIVGKYLYFFDGGHVLKM